MTTEKDFSQQVYDLGRLRGWHCYRAWLSVHSPAGFPDLLMVRGDRIIAAELKTGKGKLTLVQEEWLGALAATGKVETHCWRPEHWPQVEEALA
ncbi:MAG TPA: VRR-NUC domain-containing protein [Dehalococcoidia bacterium]|nr:VRR-NUC domain-containing protein [Dehalococcoidia bacterium]